MTTWAEVDAKLLRLLQDDGTLYGDALRIDGWNAAQEVLLAHTANRKKVSLAADGVTTQWSLPSDFLQLPDSVEAVWDVEGEDWLEEIRFTPGTEWSTERPKGYYLWQTGKIDLSWAPDSGNDPVLYFYCYWPSVTGPASVIEPPAWSIQALLYYAAAYCIGPSALQTASIRQYNQRADSGNPEDNPVHEQAKWFLNMYEVTMRRFPAQQRGMSFVPGREK